MKIYHQLDQNNFVLDSNDPEHHRFYTHQNHCCLCGHELEIKALKEEDNSLTEEAFCPSCDQKTRQKNYNIQ